MSEEIKPNVAMLEEIDFGKLARTAAHATEALWDEERSTFQRSTMDASEKVRPTVTCRCTEELLDSREAAIDGLAADGVKLLAMAKAVVDPDPDALVDASELRYPKFTRALIVATTAKAVEVAGRIPALAECAVTAREKLEAGVEELIDGRGPSEDAHPFVVFHTLRALRAAAGQLGQSTAVNSAVDQHFGWVHEETLALLAKHHLDTITPGESVVLAFCAATLSERNKPEYNKAALAALRAAVDAQDNAGSWPLGRVVHSEPSRLEISTYEVAWAVTRSFQRLLGRGLIELDCAEAQELIAAIAKAGTFAARSLVELENNVRGWASDHPYQEQRVESWTSAIVLQFAIAANDLREDIRNRAVLATFNIAHPNDELWPPWLRWEQLREAEPDSEYPIYDYLQREIIDAIKADPRELPSGRRECASTLLFGPPGTAKTTIVQAVADALGWPVVFLNPGVFIARGLEAIEAESQSVFERLQELRRAVVIFDECDELFRDRSPAKGSEQTRSISAFVTASMLPKLQDLHDKGRILFFICTNHVETMDPAVLRGGRIDHRIAVGPADRDARFRILLEDFSAGSALSFEEEGLKALADHADNFSRNELKRAARSLRERGRRDEWANADAAHDAARMVVKEMEDSLTIGKGTYDAFIKSREKYSDPFIRKAAMR